MDSHTLWDIFSGVVLLAVGTMVNGLRLAFRDLEAADKQLIDRVQKVEVMVAGNYVTREELEGKLDRLFSTLAQIDAKLDQKVNRGDCPTIHAASQEQPTPWRV